MESYTNEVTEYFEKEVELFTMIDKGAYSRVIDCLLSAYESGSTVYLMGNGGSASTASHIVCDFNKGACLKLSKKFHFVSLCDNQATILAYANDITYDEIFKMQLVGVVKESDVLIAISGSGNSCNVINAVNYGKAVGSKIIALTGYDGGKLKGLADYCIHIPINDMQKVEDFHMISLHMICQIIGKKLGNPLC